MNKLSLMNLNRLSLLKDCCWEIDYQSVPGVIVECGVYKGGSLIQMMNSLQDRTRQFILFDTFSGMPDPGPEDIRYYSNTAEKPRDDWNRCSVEDVKNNISEHTTYPKNQIKFVKGKIEDSLTEYSVVDPIALLHLDVDFYSPTAHALFMLFDKISPGGYLVIDDYGAWKGCRKAVNEFFRTDNPPLERTDYSQRYMRKSYEAIS